MIIIEQIDELRKRVDVTYEDAREALEKNNGDILDAIIYLERNKKNNTGREFTSNGFNDTYSKDEKQDEKESHSFTKSTCDAIAWCKKWIRKGNRNFFSIKKQEKIVLEIPVTLFVLLLAFAPWLTLPILILALFTGHKFKFSGTEVENTKANYAMEKVAVVVDNIKEEIKK